MNNNDIELLKAKEEAICYTHFLTLVFGKALYKIYRILGPVVLQPFKDYYNG